MPFVECVGERQVGGDRWAATEYVSDMTVSQWVTQFVEDNQQGNDYVAPWSSPPSLDDAYAVQDGVLAGLTADRGPLGGYKVAVTAAPMQEAMGLTEPLGGLVHGGQIRDSGCVLSRADFHSPAVEFEVTVRLGADVPAIDLPYTRETIGQFVGEVMTSFELVDPRGADLGAVGAVGLVADRCLCEGVILGSPVTDWSEIDLSSCEVEVDWNGDVVDSGVTGAAMGHPFEGLAWVANHMARRGRTLEAGQIVLTGSAFAPKPVAAGDTVTYRIEHLGEATVEFTG